MSDKPVVGLKPKYIHDRQRADEILEAMCRYSMAHLVIPFEWVQELAILVETIEGIHPLIEKLFELSFEENEVTDNTLNEIIIKLDESTLRLNEDTLGKINGNV